MSKKNTWLYSIISAALSSALVLLILLSGITPYKITRDYTYNYQENESNMMSRKAVSIKGLVVDGTELSAEPQKGYYKAFVYSNGKSEGPYSIFSKFGDEVSLGYIGEHFPEFHVKIDFERKVMFVRHYKGNGFTASEEPVTYDIIEREKK